MKFSQINPFVYMTLHCTCGAEIYSRKQNKDIHTFIHDHAQCNGGNHPITIMGIETKSGWKTLHTAKEA